MRIFNEVIKAYRSTSTKYLSYELDLEENQEAKDLFNIGKSYLSQARYSSFKSLYADALDKAIVLFERSVTLGYAPANYALAIALYTKEDYEKALAVAKIAIASTSENPDEIESQLVGNLSKFVKILDEKDSKKSQSLKDSINSKSVTKEIVKKYEIAELEREKTFKIERENAPLEAKALAGDADAMCLLGLKDIRIIGNSVSFTNSNFSFYWLRKSYKAGSVKAIEKLGNCYNYAIGISPDKEKAKQLYEEGWQKGDIMCLYRLCIAFASPSPKSECPKFKELLKIAKEREDLDPVIYLYFAEYFASEQKEESFSFIKKTAKAVENNEENIDLFNIGNAICTLAYCYTTGTFTEQDTEKAARYLKYLEKQNVFFKTNNIYKLTAHLIGLNENKTAADFKDIADAYNPLYSISKFDNLIKKDLDTAIDFYQKAIALGDTNCLMSLANLYFSKKEDYLKAIELYEKIAEKDKYEFNTKHALHRLETIYKKGLGVKKDKYKAQFYHKKYLNLPSKK